METQGKRTGWKINPIYREDAFTRKNEEEDAIFYSLDRFVDHLDSLALSTVEKIINSLVIEKKPAILDLMAGWNSHIPETMIPSKVVGLGLNRNELEKNRSLTECVFHDINHDFHLPFQSEYFNIVMNTVSIDYMTHPVDIFMEVGRILKPGGLFLVIFSNRMFSEKAVKVWRESSEDERVILVQEFFNESGMFESPSVFVSKGRPRPKDDKYANSGLPSDPIYAVYSDKKGGDPLRGRRPTIMNDYGVGWTPEEVERKKKRVKETLKCPYCGEKMKKWAVPNNPFSYTWDNDFMYICFNDGCQYYVRGWDHMYREGNRGISYRLMYNPENDCCSPIPVRSSESLRDGIIQE
ncbi:MAG: methyltransferase domain-containing protein [Deltaproteobacteria bacterium]|nr:methyltransferase domain-containing protein [Deltaproteobacteria bacterium]